MCEPQRRPRHSVEMTRAAVLFEGIGINAGAAAARGRMYSPMEVSFGLSRQSWMSSVLRMAGFKSAFYGEHDAYRDVSGHLGGSWIAGVSVLTL